MWLNHDDFSFIFIHLAIQEYNLTSYNTNSQSQHRPANTQSRIVFLILQKVVAPIDNWLHFEGKSDYGIKLELYFNTPLQFTMITLFKHFTSAVETQGSDIGCIIYFFFRMFDTLLEILEYQLFQIPGDFLMGCVPSLFRNLSMWRHFRIP